MDGSFGRERRISGAVLGRELGAQSFIAHGSAHGRAVEASAKVMPKLFARTVRGQRLPTEKSWKSEPHGHKEMELLQDFSTLATTRKQRMSKNLTFNRNANLENDFAIHWVYDSRSRLDLAIVVLTCYTLFLFLQEFVLVMVGWASRRNMEEYSFFVGGASAVFQAVFFLFHKVYLSNLDNKDGVFVREIAVSFWALISILLVPLQSLFVSYKTAARTMIFLMSIFTTGAVCIRYNTGRCKWKGAASMFGER